MLMLKGQRDSLGVVNLNLMKNIESQTRLLSMSHLI